MSRVLLPHYRVAASTSITLNARRCIISTSLIFRHGGGILNLSRSASSSALNTVNVTSEELCDDALNLLAPSLESYKGCNIIDILPGNGVWSRKVHGLVQPRAHILVDEPDQLSEHLPGQVEQASNSPYQYYAIPSTHPRFYAQPYFYDDIVQKLQTAQQTSGATAPTLVLANFAILKGTKRRRSKSGRTSKMESHASPFIFNFLHHLRSRTAPHTMGPARLLLWLFDRDKFNFISKSVASRTFTHFDIEEAFFPREIVGSAEPMRSRRPTSLETQSAIDTARRMLSTRLSLPLQRRSNIHDAIWGQTSTEISESIEHTSQKLTELEQLEMRWAFDGFSRNTSKSGSSDGRQKQMHPDYKRRLELHSYFNNLIDVTSKSTSHPPRDSAQRAAVCQSLLYDLDRSVGFGQPRNAFVSRTNSGNGSSEYVLQVKPHFGPYDRLQVVQQLENLKAQLNDDTESAFHRLVDEHEALKYPTPTMAWDQRDFEPLECFDHEFSPKQKLALLDFQPHQIEDDQQQPLDSMPLVRALKSMFFLSVSDALDRVDNGAADAVLHQCPTLRDITQGGKPNLKELRVRMLTPKMWREIVAAWYQWPFRKSDEELISLQGLGIYAATH